MVNEFHLTYNHATREKPELPTKEEMVLRSALIYEEYKEFHSAVSEGDFIEAADALGDLLYVVLGGMEVFGLANDFGSEMMAQIHASNMSKACYTKAEAETFIANNTENGKPIYYMEYVNGVYVLKYAIGPKKDKVAKGPNYFRPDLKFLLPE